MSEINRKNKTFQGSRELLSDKLLLVFFFIGIIPVMLGSYLNNYAGIDSSLYYILSMTYLVFAIPACVACFKTYKFYGSSKEGKIWFLVFAAMALRLVAEPGRYFDVIQVIFIISALSLHIIFITILIMRIRAAKVQFTLSKVGISAIAALVMYFIPQGIVGKIVETTDPAAVNFGFAMGAVITFFATMILLHLSSNKNPFAKVWAFFTIGVICNVLSYMALGFATTASKSAYFAADMLMFMMLLLVSLAAFYQRRITMDAMGV